MNELQYFINAYGIFHTSKLVNDKKEDLKYIKEGYVFSKELLIDDVSKYIDPITEVKTLFAEDDTLLEQLVKTLMEYTFFSIGVVSREVESVKQQLEYIKVLDDKEMEAFCNDLVTSNKALTSDLNILKYVASFVTVPVEEINNKEIKMLYMDKLIKADENRLIDGKTLIRYISYLLTESTLFVNKDLNLRSIDTEVNNMIKYILDNYEDEIASNYNTYRATLLTIKRSNKEFRTNINRITRISKKVQQKNHKIKYDTQELLDILIDDVDNDRAVFKYLDFLTYTSNKGVDYILKLIEVLTRDLYFAEVGVKIFKIRTGSQYFRENYITSHKELKIILLDLLKTYFKENVTEEIKESINKNPLWEASIERSDKKMASGVYFGSRIKLLPGDKIGIDWKDDVDFDISLINELGHVLNWNSWQYDSTGVSSYKFSGDCRTAGSEYITLLRPEDPINCYISCLLFSQPYSDRKPPEYRLFIEREIEGESTIIFQSEYMSNVKRNTSLGYIKDGHFVLDIVGLDSNRVAVRSDIDSIMMNIPTIYLKDILK